MGGWMIAAKGSRRDRMSVRGLKDAARCLFILGAPGKIA
jgi:hypothetical protein